ncbi:DCTN6 [Acanthosepion pharaonis]|uniref:Dynactin subunit 6 n=1 Tax=Acanthosepion pharaonis TaxID=158019 RepID=A0A812B3X4_ACAPH|nr:DCTN6 [Sepia pharaonis]
MAIVCKECDLIGDISIGSRTIIHPRAKIIAEAGPIIIGENNLIEEGVQIINRFPEGSPTDNQIPVMIIGNNNVFEVGSYVESLKIGDFNVVEVKASVGRQTELSSGCIVGAKCHLSTNECLEENTVIYGEECRRRVQQEHPFPQTLQLDFLSKLLPSFHHIRKPTKGVMTALKTVLLLLLLSKMLGLCHLC